MESIRTTQHDSAYQHIIRISSHCPQRVRDPLWKDVVLTEGMRTLFKTPAMQKLGRIKQLGPTFHTYPGAVHTRLDHSLGVYHAARTMLLSLLSNQVDEEVSHLFTSEGINACLTAAMLHDLGHFPFAHALKELALASHEHLATEIIKDDPMIQSIIRESIGTDVDMVCDIIDATRPTDDPETLFHRALLSGTLDPDKLDYLNRDAYFCGVPYGVQDADFIIRNMRIINPDKIAVQAVAVGAVEHLLFSKYLMYRHVYWHHAVRSATAMIKKALFEAIRESVISPTALYGLDDESFNQLAHRHQDFPPMELVTQVMENQLLQPLYEVPFTPSHPMHAACVDLESRRHMEHRIHSNLLRIVPDIALHDIIIDLPEAISFEASIPIVYPDGHMVSFNRASGIFSGALVESFTASLRYLRIFGPQRIRTADIQSVFAEFQVEGTR